VKKIPFISEKKSCKYALVLVLASTQRVPLVGDEMERRKGRRPNVSGRGKIYS
jgi:hypothetical protein